MLCLPYYISFNHQAKVVVVLIMLSLAWKNGYQSKGRTSVVNAFLSLPMKIQQQNHYRHHCHHHHSTRVVRSITTQINTQTSRRNTSHKSSKQSSSLSTSTSSSTPASAATEQLSEEQKDTLESKIKETGDKIRALKGEGADKATIAPIVDELLALKTQLDPTFNKGNKKQSLSSSSSSSTSTSTLEHPPLLGPDDFPDWAYEPRDFFRFELIHQSTKSQARVGRIHTPHGIIDTPGYVAVATNAALKGVDFRDADEAGQQLIFSNTYHLMLHPGADIIAEAGGIHQWTNRKDRPFITDSGGFQVFSLAYGSVQEELSSKGELKKAKSGNSKYRNQLGKDAVKVDEEGVVFRSYRDGSKFLLTPESTVEAQKKIGADIIIPLDELPPYHIDRQVLVESVDRSHRWEARSLLRHLKDVQNQAMFCVVHGGIDKELRTKSVEFLTSLPFDGFAIGGSLGNGKQELKELLDWMMPLFDDDTVSERKSKPRHLLGIADEESIRHAVTRGIDTLDSCYPTRVARHGTILTKNGSIKVKSGKHSKSYGVKLDDSCNCSTCQHYDRAYLWHLFKANESLAVTLAAQHNIHYMNDMMASIRQDIMEDKI
ncbi:MAG: queuine tRNA-ribosyltransferase [Bacillariaceae sp.]|jgi:queuine tRNA-ribosyltransferase